MKRITFLEKTKELELYTNRYDTVTLFEISQLYGPALSGVAIFLLSLPLLVFGAEWIALPISFLIMALGSFVFYDLRLWMPDRVKAVALSSSLLKIFLHKISKVIEKLQTIIPRSQFFNARETFFRKVSALTLLFAAFDLGFIQSPQTSYWTILALLLLSLDILLDVGVVSFVGYLCFLLGAI